jgi:ABC-2 type transport system permease protein
MESFKVAVINEIEKLYKKKKIIVAAVLSLIFIIIGQVIMVGMRESLGLRGVGSMEFPTLVLSIVSNSIIPLFIAFVTIDSFSSEFSQNVMKIALTRPVSRLKFFTAKIIAIMIFVFANLMFVMFFSIVAGFIFNDNDFNAIGFLRLIISYIVTLFPMLVVVMIIVLLCNVIGNGIGVFFTSILIYLSFKVAGMFFYSYSGILFTSMLDWYNFWIMDNIPIIKIIRQFFLMISYVILLFTAGYYLFDKKEF